MKIFVQDINCGQFSKYTFRDERISRRLWNVFIGVQKWGSTPHNLKLEKKYNPLSKP